MLPPPLLRPGCPQSPPPDGRPTPATRCSEGWATWTGRCCLPSAGSLPRSRCFRRATRPSEPAWWPACGGRCGLAGAELESAPAHDVQHHLGGAGANRLHHALSPQELEPRAFDRLLLVAQL